MTTPTDDENDKKPLSKHEQRKAQKAAEGLKFYGTLPNKQQDVVYLAREFILCTLPHSDPGDMLVWSRTNGDFTLGVVAGINVKTGKSYGIPYGIIPRLILVWIVTEIIRTKCRRLELGDRLGTFLVELGLDPSRGGKRSDARRTQEQMIRLLKATLSFDYSTQNGGRNCTAWRDMKIAPEGVLWWSEKDPEQAALFGSWIEVSEQFYKAVMENPYPLDLRVLRHIKDSSLGIDLYTILNREAYRAMTEGKPRFLAWEWLYEQTGNEYSDLRDFRRYAIIQIKALMDVHSSLILKIQKGHKGQKSGLWVRRNSRPSIPPMPKPRPLPPASETAAKPQPALALVPRPAPPPPPPVQNLHPRTVEKFRQLYPRLDVYACKGDFDAWQETLPAEDKAKQYNRAFLGFARKWIVGKVIVSNPRD